MRMMNQEKLGALLRMIDNFRFWKANPPEESIADKLGEIFVDPFVKLKNLTKSDEKVPKWKEDEEQGFFSSLFSSFSAPEEESLVPEVAGKE